MRSYRLAPWDLSAAALAAAFSLAPALLDTRALALGCVPVAAALLRLIAGLDLVLPGYLAALAAGTILGLGPSLSLYPLGAVGHLLLLYASSKAPPGLGGRRALEILLASLLAIFFAPLAAYARAVSLAYPGLDDFPTGSLVLIALALLLWSALGGGEGLERLSSAVERLSSVVATRSPWPLQSVVLASLVARAAWSEDPWALLTALAGALASWALERLAVLGPGKPLRPLAGLAGSLACLAYSILSP